VLGARRAIRVGTCGALAPGLALGELVVAREAICADGTSRALGAGERGGCKECCEPAEAMGTCPLARWLACGTVQRRSGEPLTPRGR